MSHSIFSFSSKPNNRVNQPDLFCKFIFALCTLHYNIHNDLCQQKLNYFGLKSRQIAEKCLLCKRCGEKNSTTFFGKLILQNNAMKILVINGF